MSAANPYDAVPYASLPFQQTHPDRISTIAWLFGMTPVDPNKCRVLELGAAGGGNIAPMAIRYPNSEFVGVDYSARQVADGQRVIEAAGLTNVKLMCGNIAELGSELGKFDYIITHGVYSWVPAPIQEKIMELSSSLLTENGVAYISYNVSPGWRLRGTIRDLMVYRAKFFRTPDQQLSEAKALLDFLGETVPSENSAYGMLLKSEIEYLKSLSNWYLMHEYLEEHNESIYFHDFMSRAAKVGLQYLGESDFQSMLTMNFPPPVAEKLKRLSSDIIQTEQYMDFVRNRLFRQTLLCHSDRKLERTLTGQRVLDLHVAGNVQMPNGVLDPSTTESVAFTNKGSTLTTTEPIVKAGLMALREAWPCSVSFQDLLVAARAKLRSGAVLVDEAVLNRERDQLATTMLRAYSAQLVELSLTGRKTRIDVPEKPRATKLARIQAGLSPQVATLLHELATLPDLERLLLQNLDGEHDIASLVEIVAGHVQAGRLNLQHEGQPVTDPERIRQFLVPAVQELLKRLQSKNLLCPEGF